MTTTDRAAKAPRQPLTPERIFTEALALVDEAGVDALTMRSLARRLGVEAMSIYHHIPNKDALLDGVVEQVFGDLSLFDGASADWHDETRRAAHNLRDTLLAHPNTVSLVATRRPSISYLRGPIEDAIGHLMSWGFTPGDAIDLLWMLNDIIIGNVINHNESPDLGGGDADVYGPWDPAEERRRFDRLITLLIDGVDHHMTIGPVTDQ